MYKSVLTFALFLFLFHGNAQVSLFLDTEKCETDGKLSEFYKTDSLIYFCSQSVNYGYELWSTDGSGENTKIVKDITAGIGNTDFITIKPFKKKIYFVIKNGFGIHELWESKGSTQTTKKLIQLNNSGVVINEIFPTDSSVIFSSNVNVNLNSGNLLKFDLVNSSLSTIKNGISPLSLISNRDTLFFSSYASQYGREVWYSLGDSTNTGIYYDRVVGPNSGIQNDISLCKLDNELYFLQNNVINKVDKNNVNFYFETGLLNTRNLVPFQSNGKYFFKLQSRISSYFEYSNTIFQLNENTISFRMNSDQGIEVFYKSSNNKYYFIEENLITLFDPLIISYTQILNLSGEKIVFPIVGGTDSHLIFLTKNNDNEKVKFNLKKYDFQNRGLNSIKNYEYFNPQENYSFYYSYKNKVVNLTNNSLFLVNDGINGLEPHIIDLNTHSSNLLKNTNLSISNLSTKFNTVLKKNNKLIFSKKGSTGNPAVSHDYLSSSYNPLTNVLSTISGDYIENINFYNNRIYFGNGKYSDTSMTNMEIGNIGIRPATVNPKANILLGNITTTYNNFELGGFNGFQNFLIKDINGPSKSSNPSTFYSTDSLTYFVADSIGIGRELFVTDGTTNGTRLVKNIIIGSQGIDIRYAFIYKNEFYFEFYTNLGYQIWKSNGTEQGTICFSCQFGMKEYIAHFIEKDSLFIFFNSPTFTLFRSDGTLNNTVKIKGSYKFDLTPRLINHNNKIVFKAGSPDNINTILYEIFNDSARVLKTNSNLPIYAQTIIPIDSRRILLIRKNYYSNDHFDEPFIFNYKTKDYYQISDIFPGETGSGILNFIKIDNKVLFFANHPFLGRELWQFQIPNCPSEIEIHDPINSNIDFKALYSIISNATIQNSKVNFQAAENIILKPGFQAELGSTFNAEIDGCQ